MRAGGFDRQIVIEQRAVTRDAVGSEVESWSTFAEVWAQKKDTSGREFYASNMESGEVTTKFTIRYLAGLQMDMRIKYDGLVYDIENISEIGRKRGIEISARAVKA